MQLRFLLEQSIPLLAAGLLISCGGAPQKEPPTLQERLDASKTVLQNAYYAQRLISLCNTMSTEAKKSTNGLAERWYDMNWPLVSAASQELAMQVGLWQQSQGEKASLIPPVLFALNVEEQNKAKLFRISKHWGNRDKRCERALKNTLDEEQTLSLTQNPKYAEVFAYLKGLYPVAGDYKQVLLSYQQTIVPSVTMEGRDLLVAEAQLHGACTEGQSLVLDKAGHVETYGRYCTNGRMFALDCEWGKCKLAP